MCHCCAIVVVDFNDALFPSCLQVATTIAISQNPAFHRRRPAASYSLVNSTACTLYTAAHHANALLPRECGTYMRASPQLCAHLHLFVMRTCFTSALACTTSYRPVSRTSATHAHQHDTHRAHRHPTAPRGVVTVADCAMTNSHPPRNPALELLVSRPVSPSRCNSSDGEHTDTDGLALSDQVGNPCRSTT